MKANAANVAARAAVGADDMLLKWQMMAAQGRQKRQGGDAGDSIIIVFIEPHLSGFSDGSIFYGSRVEIGDVWQSADLFSLFATRSGAAEDGAANRGGGSSAEGVSASHSDKKLENGDSATAGPGNTDADSQGPPSASTTGRPPGKLAALTCRTPEVKDVERIEEVCVSATSAWDQNGWFGVTFLLR